MKSISRKFLVGAGLLTLSATAAAAIPATVRSDLNLRSGPGTQYSVVGSMPAGATVDVGTCTGGWCSVAYGGDQGYASRSYLDLGAAAVPVVPYDEPAYGYAEPDYYGDDYYYGYGPSVTFGFGYGGRRHWHGRRGDWRHRDGRPGYYGRVRPGSTGGSRVVQGPPRGGFMGNTGAGYGRQGSGGATVGAGASVQRSAPAPSYGNRGSIGGGRAPSATGGEGSVRPGFGRQ